MNTTKTFKKVKLFIMALAALMAVSLFAFGAQRANKANAATTIECNFAYSTYVAEPGSYALIQICIPGVDLGTYDFSALNAVRLKGNGTNYSLADYGAGATIQNCTYVYGAHYINLVLWGWKDLFGYTFELENSVSYIAGDVEYVFKPFKFSADPAVENIFNWGSDDNAQTTIAIYVDMKKDQWNTWSASYHAGNEPSLHRHFTLNGIRYNNPEGTAYTFEEYPGVNLYLESQFLGGPAYGYAGNHTIALFFLYGLKGEGVYHVPNDTIIVVDGPVCNFLGEPFIEEVVTYQKTDGNWKKVSGISLTAPTTTEYLVGEALDTTGAKINISYADGTSRSLDYTDALTNTDITGYDNTLPGTKTATVNYHGVQLSFNYTVKAPLGDVFANDFAYSATETTHNVNFTLTSEITSEEAADLADALTVTGDGRTLSAITGATLTANGTAVSVSIPKSEVAGFYGKGLTLAADLGISEGGKIKAFEHTFAGNVLGLAPAGFFENFQGNGMHIGLIYITEDPIKAGYNSLSALENAITVVTEEGSFAFSDIDGAYITYSYGDGYLWVYVPVEELPSMEGYYLVLDEAVVTPSLDTIAPFEFRILGNQICSVTYIDSVTSQGAAGIRFNIVMPGHGNDDVGDLGVDGHSLHDNIYINGQSHRFTYAEENYQGFRTWVSGQSFGGKLILGLESNIFCVIGFQYQEQVFGEAGVRNYPEGTLVILKKEFNIKNYTLDRDYTYQLVNDNGTLVWKEVVSATVTAPGKTRYLVSETLETAGISVTVNYTDETSATYAYGDYFTVEGFDNINAGENKTAYVNYRGIKLPFNYSVERVAGEINAVFLNYTSDATNQYVIIGINDELPAANDYSALLGHIAIGNTAISDIAGTALAYMADEYGYYFVIAIPRTSYAFTGSFTVTLAEDYSLMEGTALKAFSSTYATSEFTLIPGAFFANFNDEGMHIALLNVPSDPIKGGYADFSNFTRAIRIVSGNESVALSDTNGGYVTYIFDPNLGAGYLWIYIPVSDYPSFDGCHIVLDESALTPSLDTIAPFDYVIYGSGIFTETHIERTLLQPATPDVLTANIRFDIYMPGHDTDPIIELGQDGHSIHNNLWIDGQQNRFTFVKYPGIEFWLGTQSLGIKVINVQENDLFTIILFLYGDKGEGPRNFPEGTIVKLGKNFNIHGFILDRDYTYQLVTENNTPAWKEVTSVSITDSAIDFYAVGETLDTHDVKVSVTYADGTTKVYDVTNDESVTLTGFDSSAANDGTVTFNYHGYNFSYGYSVKEVTGYTVVSEPTKTVYKVGEVMNLSGLEIRVNFGEGYYRTVNFGYGDLPAGFTVEGFTTAEANDELVITIGYGENEVASVTVKVEPPIVENITVTAPVKVNYFVGDELDLTGGYLVAYYDTGIYSANIALDAEGVTVTGFESSVAATITVTVTFEGVSDTFEVTVAEIAITYVEGHAPTYSMYERWTDELTLEGGYFTVYYNNGSSETVDFTSEYVTFEFDKTDEAEIIEITAFYGNNYPFSFTSQNIYYIDDGSCVAGIATSMYAVLGLLAIAAIGIFRKSDKH